MLDSHLSASAVPTLLRFQGTLNGVPCTVHMDTGASRSLVHAHEISRHGLLLWPYAPVVAKSVTHETITIHNVVQARRSHTIQRV
jgi:hypothetical protein